MENIINIPIITSCKHIREIPLLPIQEFNWGGDYRPNIYGRLALLESNGFLVEFICHESSPSCQYMNDLDPVYMDSAVEFFIQLPAYHANYLNVEMNSNGALLAAWGAGKKNRYTLPLEQVKQISREVSWNSTHSQWNAFILLPFSVLQDYIPYDFRKIAPGFSFRFQLYKQAEGSYQTHFCSLGPIQSKEPNFHLPEYFLTGVLTD